MRQSWLLILLAFAAGLVGAVAGHALAESRRQPTSAVHDLLHEELDLTRDQVSRIDGMEATFDARRRALEAELRADNARLAAAIQAEQGYGPRVTAEVDRSHQAMGQLQKETLAHIFGMRAVLRPEQAAKFDQVVVKALTNDAR